MKKRSRIRVLRDVAWGPSVETGASVPGYSGGLAAKSVISSSGIGRGFVEMVAHPRRKIAAHTVHLFVYD